MWVKSDSRVNGGFHALRHSLGEAMVLASRTTLLVKENPAIWLRMLWETTAVPPAMFRSRSWFSRYLNSSDVPLAVTTIATNETP